MDSIEEYLRNEVQKKDLKIQALLEKVSELTAEYENKCADYRVDLTLYAKYLEQMQEELEQLKGDNGEKEDPEA